MKPMHESGVRIEPAMIPGPAGQLEASLRIPVKIGGVAVIAHPHPLHGGTMHTKAVHRAARFLTDRFGLASVRFNFRGVGASDGHYDQGRGEVEDLVAAIRFSRRRFPDQPLLLSGFSFGSLCAMWAGIREQPLLLFLFGIPLVRWERQAAVELGPTPVVWVQGENDEYGEASVASATAGRFGWDLFVVEGADHFFTNKLDEFEEIAVHGLASTSLLPDLE